MDDVRQAMVGLHLLTIDTLLDDLVGGRTVALDDGRSLALEDKSRAVLNWYRNNRDRWAANLKGDDVEAIVDAVGGEPPSLASERPTGRTGTTRILRLQRLRAHRFAGLHAFQCPDGDAQPFVFEPGKPVTLVEGVNGSGKTSIANAIMWCLTGHLIRSQREPGLGTAEYLCEVDRGGTTTNHLVSSVTPMPKATDTLPAEGSAIPADTWVEITFSDERGEALPPVRRTQSRSPRGKLVEVAPDLDLLGVDPVAWRIATVMPALIPHLAVGSTSQLGEAVARLTGLAPLVDLSKHAGKASERIRKRMVKDLAAEGEDVARRYSEAKGDLEEIVGKSPAMQRWGGLPRPSDADARERLVAAAELFVSLKTAALRDAREILGEGFDPERKLDRDGLERDIGPATEQVTIARLADLPSLRRLSALSLSDAERDAVLSSLDQLRLQAATLDEMAASPDRARRAQLYARVSAWMREHDHVGDTCPVCVRPLDGTLDPVSGNKVGSHLAEAERDGDFVARTVEEWSSHWRGHLIQNLPEVLGTEVRRSLPASPAALLREGFTTELFATPAFAGVLSALRPDAESLVDDRLETLPAFCEPTPRPLPRSLSAHTAPLQETIDRLGRALAFAEWRQTNSKALRETFIAVRTGTEGQKEADRAIANRLSSLRVMVQDAAPLSSAITLVGRLGKACGEHGSKLDRIARCERAAASLDALVPLGELAQSQVDLLRGKLHGRADHWRRTVFLDPTTFSPFLADTRMDATGVLALQAGRLGVTAPAQHVSNASSLRGAILGFFMAFREHVLATRGGLSLLCLDDPQELLDNDNKERLARGLASLAADGAQLLVTTHDRKFARSLVAESRQTDCVVHLSVHPVNASRHTVALSPAVEEVDRKRQAFDDNPDSARHALDYASDLRIFVEARLGDLFDNVAHPAHAAASRAPTLNTLLSRYRALVTAGNDELFRHPIVTRFAREPALADGAPARRVLNQSHHDRALVGYADVAAVKEAFVRLRVDVEKVHEQFRLHRWREPLAPAETGGATVIAFPSMRRPAFSVPVCPDLAAFSAGSYSEGSQDVPSEVVDVSWFEGKSLFYIRYDTLGFAIPSGAVAIVEAEPYPGRDQNLVVAKYRNQLLARRVVKSRDAPGVSLSAQMPNPSDSRPTMTFDESKVRLHRVVGAIFADMPPPGVDRSEATLMDDVPELGSVEVAYRVKEDSAVPLVLPGQVVLGGAELSATDLDRCEGKLVAVTLNDGSSIFKRVGSRLPGSLAHLRQFETIGGLGGSLVVATEAVEGTTGFPLMTSARQIVGVLYDNG